ncbi:MAG TPA: S41 family peptidase, partial [Symbiobacteriaceae bacterium]|nr:S41 family peptidase [Symbiobacteriaceae bacterium]
AELSRRLTEDLQQYGRDKHFKVLYSPEILPPPAGFPTDEQLREWDLGCVLDNGGFHKVERLAGNVGYLEITSFAPPEVAGPTAAAAMHFLAGTSAMIIDLRNNGGGGPQMVAMICSYFFRFSTHLSSMYWREGDRMMQFWTVSHLPGPRYLEKPVYVLTSSRTFSGGEDFCYSLQALKRATIVGEQTRGGAHPVRRVRLDDHFEVTVPAGRVINPVTGGNWEGTGVSPDVAVPGEQAFAAAYALALEHVISVAGRETVRPWRNVLAEAEKALAGLKG